MSTMFSFQTQLVTIMDALSKTAVMEISKLVEMESKTLKLEITRGRTEIASLKEKLQLMENLLWLAQGQRQDASEPSVTPEPQNDPENNCKISEPERTRPPIKSESSLENTCAFYRGEVCSPAEPTDEGRAEPDLSEMKREPSAEDDVTPKPKGAHENRGGLVTDVLKSSAVPHNRSQQPALTESSVAPVTRSPVVGTGTQHIWWISPAHTEIHGGRPVPTPQPNVEPAWPSMSQNMRVYGRRNPAKRFVCSQCGKIFRCFSQLEVHGRSHTGEKPFRCTLCGKRYAQKGHLYTHQRTHTGEKPYRCPLCGKGFVQKCTLDMHQRTHTGEKPYVCVKCGKGFTKNCNLKKHLVLHLDPTVQGYHGEISSRPTHV